MSIPLRQALEGKYEILEKIGEGGIGAVYKVRHRLLEEVRVIKVLRPHVAAKQDLQERFLHEARMAIRLKHPNIAQLHDFSIADDGTAYIVMEYIDGVALDALLRASGPPSRGLTIEIARQGLEALHYLHEHEFVHRDVSPDNLMLSAGFDGSPVVKLIDLGIAKNLGEEVQLTATGVFLGKVRYCSPEQFSAGSSAEAELDRRSDLYSFGVMLYELLTGEYPFEGESFAELAGSHLFQQPKGFEVSDPDGRIPEGLREVVLRALDKEPGKRWSTAHEFAERLGEFAEAGADLREELDHTVEITTTALPREAVPGRPGSTQDRFDRQFGLGPTPAPDSRTAADHGGHTRLIGTEAPARPAAQTPARPVPGRLGRTAAVVLAVAVPAAALAGWLLLRRPPAASGLTAQGTAGRVTLTPRFSPAEVAGDVVASLAAAAAPAGAGAGSGADDPPAGPQGPGAASQEAGFSRTAPSGTGAADPVRSQAATAGTQPSGTAEPRRAQEIYEPGVGVVMPVQLTPAAPVYPPDVRVRKEPVELEVEVLVDEYGKVVEAKASGKRGFRDAAEAAAARVEFRPASRNGVLGRMRTTLTVVFEPE